ncbi:MAG: hypothetical protein L0387_25055 [Acidobacteria bacterium]|nr:hypothetical protein [Acidobacteriota bacterium]MCI0724416.1 hypothetical protein [Acidobacteriota bacterium]
MKRSLAGFGGLLSIERYAFAAAGKKIPIRGAYGSPKTFWDKGGRLNDYGINALFVHSGSIDEALVRRAREEGAKVYAEFATFNGSGWLTRREGELERAVAEHADAWPIDASGQPSPRQTWFLGVCPTNEAFIRAKLEALKQLITAQRLDGVWLDYLHWHAQFEDPKPRLPETCFNESCVTRFQERAQIQVKGSKPEEWARDILKKHEKAWRSWRCSVLADFARSCREVMWQHAPHLLLGNYQCAWRDDEHGGARREILGLDLSRLSEVFDVMSPMAYHARSGHSARWVEQNVKWLSGNLALKGAAHEKLKIWPIVQAWSDPQGNKVSPEDFEKVLWNGTAGGATGVMMFTLGAVAEDEAKLAILKKVYGQMGAA